MLAKRLLVLTMTSILLASCAGSGEAPKEAPSGSRVIEIQALDSLRFEPDRVTVTAGETVQFVLTNSGVGDHEFIVGDEAVQAAHQESGGHGDDALAIVELPSGATESVVVTFAEPGELLFGCHVDGHYAAGMVGTIIVEAA